MCTIHWLNVHSQCCATSTTFHFQNFFYHCKQTLYLLNNYCSFSPSPNPGNLYPTCCLYVCAQLLSCVRLFATPWTVACQAPLVHGSSLSKNTGVGCHFPLQGIFPIQGSNLGLLNCRQILYQLSFEGIKWKMLKGGSLTGHTHPGSHGALYHDHGLKRLIFIRHQLFLQKMNK